MSALTTYMMRTVSSMHKVYVSEIKPTHVNKWLSLERIVWNVKRPMFCGSFERMLTRMESSDYNPTTVKRLTKTGN